MAPEDTVLDLRDIRIADAPRVGPKVARLGQLASAGWRVPDGYAVTVGALGSWLPPAARRELARMFTGHGGGEPAGSAGLAGLARQARELVEGQPFPAWLEDAVATAHERLARRTGHGTALRVAVRSSAVSEDGAGASFAGQYDTYLGVAGVDGVLRHIRKCWASGYSAHALEYRRRRGASGPGGPAGAAAGGAGTGGSPLLHHHLAVGVLELVDARCAGVAFTIDPVTGDRDRLVVEANWGFGESVVSGQVTPDHWEVDRASGQIRAERVAVKERWSVFDPGAGAVVLRAAPAGLAGLPCLTTDEVRYLCRRAADIEAAEGVPQDVEWAIANDVPFPGSVFILQHRPETAWAPPAPSPAPAPAQRAFDPVQYALRNVFRVPGT